MEARDIAMSDKHTPGPWRTVRDIRDLSYHAVYGDNDFKLARVFPETFSAHDETMHANARLIAAAPDLLAVVRRLATEGVTLELHRQARDALDKATQP
jgi:hypothetical protein